MVPLNAKFRRKKTFFANEATSVLSNYQAKLSPFNQVISPAAAIVLASGLDDVLLHVLIFSGLIQQHGGVMMWPDVARR